LEGGGSERHYHVGGGRVIETEFGSLKVPRQCPLVLLVESRLVFGICSIMIFKDVGAALNSTTLYIASACTALKTPLPKIFCCYE
jgi:hypothetical protein